MRQPLTHNADTGFFRFYHFPNRDKSAATDESGLSDSIWAVVAGTVKAFNMPVDYVLYDLSWANMILYGATLPSLNSGKDKTKGEGEQEIIKADDPKNRDKVREFLDSIKD